MPRIIPQITLHPDLKYKVIINGREITIKMVYKDNNGTCIKCSKCGLVSFLDWLDFEQFESVNLQLYGKPFICVKCRQTPKSKAVQHALINFNDYLSNRDSISTANERLSNVGRMNNGMQIFSRWIENGTCVDAVSDPLQEI